MKNKRFPIFILLVILGISFCFIPAHKKKSTKIPVIFTVDPYHPLVKLLMRGNAYTFLVDTGTYRDLYLCKNVFEKIPKIESEKSIKILDLRGNVYKWPIYSVSDVKIGTLAFSDLDVIEESLDFDENTKLWPSPNSTNQRYYHGRIGWQFFKDYCPLFDFPNSSIFLAKRLEDLKGDGLLKIENYIKVPIDIENGMIVLSIETDQGKQQVILDTGSTFCTLKTNKIEPTKIKLLPSGKPYFPSNKLMIEGYNFGRQPFALTEITDLINADGVLGADFFLKHAICFDFANHVAYIEKPVGQMATFWKRIKYHLTQLFLRNISKLPKVEDP